MTNFELQYTATILTDFCHIDFGRIGSNIPSKLHQKRKSALNHIENSIITPSKLARHNIRVIDQKMPLRLKDVNICLLETNPLYSFFEQKEERFSSFAAYCWPKALEGYQEGLSNAGFFFRQDGDSVICFHCGVIISGWRPNISPEDVELEGLIQHCIAEVRCRLILPLYRDKVFRTAFTEWDVKRGMYQYQNFLQEIGSSSEDITSYFEEREKIDKERKSGEDGAKTTQCLQPACASHEKIGNLEKKISFLEEKVREKSPIRPLCGICNTKPKRIMTFPCGHIYSCGDCFATHCKNNSKIICFYCRVRITGYSHAFLT